MVAIFPPWKGAEPMEKRFFVLFTGNCRTVTAYAVGSIPPFLVLCELVHPFHALPPLLLT